MKEMKTDTLWDHLHWLTVLAEQGSFTRAAERLDVSKAAMSQKIKELEEMAGVLLVQRTTRSVRLTSAGEKLVEELREPFARIEQSFFSVRDIAGPVRGLVRITAPVAFARQQLVPIIGEFLRDYPQVRLQLDVTDRIVSLSSEGFDLAIRHSDTLPETHVALPLCDTRTLLVASPAYLNEQGIPQSPQDLAQHNCLYYPRGVESPRWRFTTTADNEQVQIRIQGSFATNNSESIRDAALQGLGIAMLPDFSAREALAAGSLQQVLPAWQPVEAFAARLWIVRPWAAQVPRAVTTFTHWLRARFDR
ncbi:MULTISPECIES: LysR substrate-binding domain-containing protein [Pantoea]|uniref:LysR substrate-binding domain-containing protein n=1 Tax=Pantoea TaxID=53335 RepID=UPI0002554456|nr:MULTISPECIES: LysR family transcriptional regulator [Pantoea]AZI49813.1 LysR family transcriptional regulator [Pantoea agglomerans]KOA70922.1 LysR family transcriptional regulator [Pantoea sp. CFSAN033090]MDY0993717.1 LysR substrate-binding domain-containing protein [Pantoea agglomerans]NYB29333.1 LysR family transcriptional regulator [Pantoea agglomerans]UVV72361.1 LysR family transcriptional regulator [Pantoea agglomerans]